MTTKPVEQHMDGDVELSPTTPAAKHAVVPLQATAAPQAGAIIASVQLEKVRDAYQRLAKNTDAEALHDFRVGLRQLRSTFSAYPEAFPRLSRKLRKRMRTLARDTSHARDSEVQLEWLRSCENKVKGEGRLGYQWLERQLELRTAKAYRRLRADVLDEFSYIEQKVRDVLARAEAQDADDDNVKTLGQLCGAHLNELVGEFTFHLRHIETREDEDQVHAARICGKRIRYLLTPLKAELKGCESVIRRLQRLQDILGEFHDAQVFSDVLRRLTKKAAIEQSERLVELMLNAAPDTRTLAQERKQDNVTGLLLISRLVAKRKVKLFEQLGRMQSKGAHEQLLHDIAMLAAGLQGHPDQMDAV